MVMLKQQIVCFLKGEEIVPSMTFNTLGMLIQA
jgi:hypothetical protein